MPEEEKSRAHEDALDRFWTIDELLPRRQGGNRVPPQPVSTDPVEMTFSPPGAGEATAASSPLTLRPGEVQPQKLVHREIPQQSSPAQERRAVLQPIDVYHPENSLLHTVRIYRWPAVYQYYERFLADARRYLHTDAPPCPREPFFSYVPQYTQLTKPRLNWYFYWRSEVRAGRYPDCDYTYLLLYLYEIINLGREIGAESGLRELCAIWREYRGRYPRLDRFLGEWICDYCLIYHLPPPLAQLNDAISLVVTASSLKEFWLSSTPAAGEAGRGFYVRALLQFASNYDYHTSKFATPENLSLYDRQISGAITRVVETFAADPNHMLSGGGLQDSLLSRDAFGGALCAYENKYRIEVDYCCFTRSHELRFLVTDMIKYAENRLRAYLGIKSRLGLYALPANIRAVIDDYMNETLPSHAMPTRASSARARAEEEEERRYAPLYEPLSATLSPDHAAEIEQASWQTTQRLIEAFGEDDPVEQPPAVAVQPETVTVPLLPVDGGESLAERLRKIGLDGFVRAVRDGNAAAVRAEAKGAGLLPDAAADRVNEAAIELIGDILLEDDGGLRIVDDYLEEVRAL